MDENPAEWTIGSIKHLGSCLSGGSKCIPRVLRDEVPLAPSVQPLTCEVNINKNLADIERVNLTQTTLVPVLSQSKHGLGSVVCQSCPGEQRVRGSTNRRQTQVMAGSGKTPSRTETFQSIQRDRTVFGAVCCSTLGQKEVVHREMSRDSSMSFADFKHPEQNRHSRVLGGQTRKDVCDSRLGRRIFSGTSSRTENTHENETRGDGTRNTEDCNSSQQWRRRVRKPENTTVDGTSLGTQWSRCDTRRDSSGIMLTTTWTHLSTTQPPPPIYRNFFPKSSSSRHAPQAESQIDGVRRNRRIRKVGMKLTGTVLFTFSQVCQDWNQSKIVVPYLHTLCASRVDVLEVGWPTDSV